MRLVLDTNVVVSAMLWGGRPRLLLDAARAGRVRLFTSTPLLAELDETLRYPKFRLSCWAGHSPRLEFQRRSWKTPSRGDTPLPRVGRALRPGWSV